MAPILFSTAEILRFVIVLTRISGIMIAAPFFSNQLFPPHVRIAFTLMTAFVMAPSLPLNQIPAQLDLSGVAGLCIGEIAIGLVIGFVALCVFSGLQFAGQIVSFQLGFSLINLIDPQSNVESTVFSFFYNYIGLLLFLLINGHHWFLQAINESFSYIAVGGMQIHKPLVELIVQMSAHILVIGIRIAGPILAVTVISDMLIGIIGRTAPQINILVVGMPLKLLVGFGCLSFSLYFLPSYLGAEFSVLSKTLFSLVRAM
jgi:flagellar biosynthesis protein FliR